MENLTSIPKQLQSCRKTSSFIQDEKGADVLLCYDNINRDVFINRYNNYQGVVTALIVMTIIAVVSLSALLYF